MFVKHDIDSVVDKANGKFRSTVLIQKRLKGLAAGTANTIEYNDRAGLSVFEVVFEEIFRDNIDLTLANIQNKTKVEEEE